MARLNVRIRTALFSALMDQELAYFNATKTGAPLPNFDCLFNVRRF